MKIAVCLSGQPRFVKECFEGIRNNIFDSNKNHEIDVFVHTWFSKELCNKVLYVNEMSSFSGEATIPENSLDLIKSLYNPKKIIYNEPKKFKSIIDFEGSLEKYLKGYKTSGMSREDYRNVKLESTYSMWYSIMVSNLLKKEYELENGFTYDFVIKLRFDNIITQPIVFDSFDNNFLYYQELGQPDNMVSDWINFSSSENMDSYSSIFLSIDKLANKSISQYGGWTSESLIRQVCNRDNIKTYPLWLNTQLPRWGKI